MTSVDPLTRQRELLRALRQADALRLEAVGQYKAGSAELQRAGLTDLLDRVRLRMPVAAPGVAPLAELDRFTETARKATADLHSAVDALLHWRKRLRSLIIAATIVSIALCIALALGVRAVYHRFIIDQQPTTFLDSNEDVPGTAFSTNGSTHVSPGSSGGVILWTTDEQPCEV
jgi:hypothetical protein